MTYSYANAEKTAIQCSDGRCIPVCEGNRDYDEIVTNNIVIQEYTEPKEITMDTHTVIISSDNITVTDADLLLTAANNGDKTSEWLIAKLEL